MPLQTQILNQSRNNSNYLALSSSSTLLRMSQEKSECVKVALRCRPMSSDQVTKNFENIVKVDSKRGEVSVKNMKNPEEKDKVFTYDMTFQPGCRQEDVFKQAALPVVESVLEGYNGTIFAYGQTGTGKTHTMEGSKTDLEERGVIPRTFEHIFKCIEGTPSLQFVVQASMLELYNEEIVDLLVSSKNPEKLNLHETADKKVYVKGLKSFEIKNVDQMMEKLRIGSENRHVGSTQMNKTSSRSHSIFIIKIETLENLPNGESKVKAGRLNLVDLAGSERQKKTQATGGREQEGIHINLSLSTLGQCISALTNPNATHVPFRDSKLTRLLQDSLGGNTKTIMIANVGPASHNYEQTITTLGYASRAKRIQNKPKINEDPKDALIRQYQEQIQELQRILQGKPPKGPGGSMTKVIEKPVIVKKTPDAKKQEINQKLEEARRKEEQEKAKAEEELKKRQNEKDQLKEMKKNKELEAEREKQEQEELVRKLKEMKERLLHGDQLKQKARQHEKEELKIQQELEERIQKQRRLKEELENKDVLVDQIVNMNKHSKEEVEQKSKKLNELVNKAKRLKEQTNEIHEFRTSEREELENQNRELIKELKFINLLIQNFIPVSEVRAFHTRLEFSDEIDDWIIKEEERPDKPNPGSALGLKHPLCEFARMAISLGDDNPRFRPDNILKMDLDLPERTTEQLEHVEISPKISETINVALVEDEEEQKMIANEKQPNVYIQDPHKMNKEEILRQKEEATRAKSAKKMRPASGRKKK